MEQAPKPTEAPPAKGKKTWAMIAAVVIIVIVVVAGLYFAGYFGTTGGGTPVSIFETPSASCSNVQPANCGYNPSSLPVTAGTTVTWTNNGNLPHSVTACYSASSSAECPTPNSVSTPAFDSGSASYLNAGQKFSFKFNTPGTFNYYCRVHSWMHGTVVVT